MGKFVTNWDIKDWASFLGSYLGGTLGAFITLYGIKWQVTREESQKERNDLSSFLKALKYNINRNLNDKDLEVLKYILIVLKMQKFYMIRLISYTH